MPSGLARMIYWPDEKRGFRWAVESKNKKGWNRFTEHIHKAECFVLIVKAKIIECFIQKI
jgi:hypothetical protein